jgi:hypothetical protein
MLERDFASALAICRARGGQTGRRYAAINTAPGNYLA